MTSRRLTRIILDALRDGQQQDIGSLLMSIRKRHDADPTHFTVLLAELEQQGFIQQIEDGADLYVRRHDQLN